MNLVTAQSELAQALKLLARAIPAKPSHPILANVLLQAAADGTLTATAYDLKLAVRHSWTAQVETPGIAAIPYRLLADLVARLPDDQAVTLRIGDEFVAHIETAASNYDISGDDPADYPDLPILNAAAIALPFAMLSDGIKAVSGVASSDESKLILQAIRLRYDEIGAFDLAATDGHRLSIYGMPVTDAATLAIPAKSLREVLRIDNAETVDVAHDRGNASLQIGETTIITRLMDGTFPNVEQLIPKKFDYAFTVNRGVFIDSLERVAVIADRHNDVVKIQHDGNTLSINAETDYAAGGEVINIETTATKKISLAINVKYILEALKSIKAWEITMSYNTSTLPVIIQSAEDLSAQLALIMPVQVGQ